MYTRGSALLSKEINRIITDKNATLGAFFNPLFYKIIEKLFANNEQGFFYDPNDLSTMFQDAAGTVPVTGSGQPVGLWLDKSRGLSLGSELFVNPTITGEWVSLGGGVYECVNSIGTSDLIIDTGIIGKFYTIEFEIIENSAAVVAYQFVGAPTTITTTGKFKYIRLATTSRFMLRVGAGRSAKVRLITAKEIAGNHAYQSTSAARPIYRQKPILENEILPTYDFRTWVANGSVSSVTPNSFYSTIAGGVFTNILKPNTKYWFELDFESTSGISVYHGSESNTSFAAMSRRVVKFEATTDSGVRLYLKTAASGSITVHSIKIQEITGYRTDQNYLEFDGTDDFLQTANIDFTVTDKVSLFAGVTNFKDQAACIAELSNSILNNAGVFTLMSGTDAARVGYFSYSAGSASPSANFTARAFTFNAPNSAVLSAKHDISGDLTILRVNSAAWGGVTPDKGSGNYGNYPLYIGRRGGTALPFNGHIYSLIGVGKLVSSNETVTIEKELAKRLGVTINV